jgi:hypothetical protein
MQTRLGKAARGLPLFALILSFGCGDPTSPSKSFTLSVLERSATTLTLQWDPIEISNGGGYTVDYLTGLAGCAVIPPQHGNILEVGNVTTVVVTGLSPSTDYQIHVHRLIGSTANQSTTFVFVRTLATGAANTPVTAADYQRC